MYQEIVNSCCWPQLSLDLRMVPFGPYFAWKHRYMDMMNVTLLINYCFYTCFFYANRYDSSFHQNMVNEIRYIQLIDLLTLESRLLDGLYEDKWII